MIRFNLNKIIHKYNREHPLDRLTIAKLSRQTGVSRHALTTLSGKHGKPSGIQFATLDKLIEFFKVPVDEFISYAPSGVVFVLKDAATIQSLSSNLTDKSRAMMTKSVAITVLNEPKAIRILALSEKLGRGMFIISFGLLSSHNTAERFENLFNNASDRIKVYLYSRILAHSGLLTKQEIHDSNNLSVIVTLEDPSRKNIKVGMTNLSDTFGLPKGYILKNQSVIHDPNGYHIIDKTTNQFRK